MAEYQNLLASSYHNLGVLNSDAGRTKEAEAAHVKALAIWEKLATAFPSVLEYQNDLALSHNRLGSLFSDNGRKREAVASHAKALAIQEKLAAANPSASKHRNALAMCHNSLGNLYSTTGQTNEAEAAYAKALAIREKLAAANPSAVQYEIGVGGTLVSLGHLFRGSKQSAKALDCCRRSIRLMSVVIVKEPREMTAVELLHKAHWGEAVALGDLNLHGEAVAAWRKAIEFSPPAERRQYQANLAYSLARAGMVAEAVKAAEALSADPEDRLIAASVLSLASAAKGVAAADRDAWQKRAVERLGRAKREAKRQTTMRMSDDKDLEPLRGREDFKKLTAPAR